MLRASSNLNMNTSPGQSVFQLLSLPPELRTLVFHHVLLWHDQPLRFCSACNVTRPVRNPLHPRTHMEPNFLATLLVSKQFYHEAMPVFYGHNRFLAAGVKHCVPFLKGIGPERRTHLRDLDCRIGFSLFSYGCLKYLASCTGLRSLRIRAVSQSLVEQKRGGAFEHLHSFGTVTVNHHGHTIGVSHSKAYRNTLGKKAEPSRRCVRSSRVRRIVESLTSECPPRCPEHRKTNSLVDCKVELYLLDNHLA